MRGIALVTGRDRWYDHSTSRFSLLEALRACRGGAGLQPGALLRFSGQPADGDDVKLQHARRSDDTYRHPAWISRARARMRDHRGTTLVEAAFVTPIFLLFIMAIAESGLFMRNYLGAANAVRAGARSASAWGAEGRDGGADLYIVHSIGLEASALPRNSIQYVVVYKATGFGAGPTESEEDGVPTGCKRGVPVAGLCNVYTPAHFALAEQEVAERARHAAALAANPADVLDESKLHFGCGAGAPDRFWCPTDRADRVSSNGGWGPDYVGVFMKVRHNWLTGIFGEGNFITDQSVVKIEPKRLQ